jgi:hypothetical protein
MSRSVNFDDQLGAGAKKIGNEVGNDNLAPKFVSAESPVAKPAP